MKNSRTEYFDEYMDSIFASGNELSPEEFKLVAADYEEMYGQFLPSSRDAAILDAGSGAGHFLYFLKKKGYVNYTGVDISHQQIEFCRKNISENVVLADIFDYLQEKKGCFDLISVNDVLEHIPKERVHSFLCLARQTLKPNGKIILKTPNMGNFFSLYPRYKDFTHESGFTEKSLHQVLWLAGFRDMTIFGPEAHYPKTIKGKLQKSVSLFIRFALRKLYQYQGYVAPEIMSPLLVTVAVK